MLALVRCSRVASKRFLFIPRPLGTNSVVYVDAAVLSAIDYKMTMLKNYETERTEHDAYSECHVRSAKRVLKALLANGGLKSAGTISYPQVIVF